MTLPALAVAVALLAPAAPAEQPGAFERYLPLVLEEELAPEVDEQIALFFLGGLLPAGQVYLPLIGGLDLGNDYLVDAAVIAALHLFPHLFLLALVIATPVGVIPVVGWALVAGIYLLNVANLAAFVVNNFYCTPVAVANEASRHARSRGGGKSNKSKPPPRRRKKKDAALLTEPGPVALAY